METTPSAVRQARVPGSSTGIDELDRITGGGLPRGRLSAVFGAAGSGKTPLGLTFLARGVEYAAESGVLLSFAEQSTDIAALGRNAGIDIDAMVESNMLRIDHVPIDPALHQVAGAFDIEALFVRLEYAVSATGARRVFIDAIGNLFAAVGGPLTAGREFRRMARCLGDLDVTTLISIRDTEHAAYRQCIEDQIADVVLYLNRHTSAASAIRELRIARFPGMPPGIHACMINVAAGIVRPTDSAAA